MGNDISSAVATAGAKKQMNDAMKQVNGSLKETDPKKAEGAREREQRRKDREEEFKEKKAAREARKGKLSEQWATHKKDNSAAPKKGFFGK